MALQLDLDCMPSERDFLDSIWAALSKLYGEYGASLASLVLIDYIPEKRLAVLRANLGAAEKVRVALASMTSIAGRVGAVHVLRVSGTIKALREQLKA
jgi:RNase P/RNase MRP subunit POP5